MRGTDRQADAELPDVLDRERLSDVDREMLARALATRSPQASDERISGSFPSSLVLPIGRGTTVTGVVAFFAAHRHLPGDDVLAGLGVIATAVGDRLSRGLDGGALSPRELEVVRLASFGLTNGEIASRLSVSVPTVKTHLTHVFAKLAAPDRAAAVARALRDGLIG